MPTKDEIRKIMRQRRRELTNSERECAAQELAKKLEAEDAIGEAIAAKRPIVVYLATADELSLAPFIAWARQQKAKLQAPRWTGKDYCPAPLPEDPTEWIEGPHRILEPPPAARPFPEAAVWLVPGLAFTLQGARLGYGGGWYDRMLSAADPKATRLGIAYGFQLLPSLPTTPEDQPLTRIVSVD